MSTGVEDEQLRQLQPNEYRDVIGHFASGVTVITSSNEGEKFGTTASAVSSLSLEPPMMLICLNKSSTTGQAVSGSGHYAVNILSEGQADEAMRFAKSAKPGEDKFAGIGVETGVLGDPLLSGSLATLECKVAEEVEGGTHIVFLATVERATARPGSPLAYFKGKFGRLELAQDESALNDIRTRVLARELAVGEPIALDDLAERLGHERGPVYHALTRLTGEGLVTRDGQGAFVVEPLTLEAVREAWKARCAIELGVASLTVGQVDTGAVTQLGELADAAAPAQDGFSMESWLPTYAAFHEGLVALSGTAQLVDAYRRVNAPAMILSLTQQQMVAQGLDRDQAATAHRHIKALADAYAAGDLGAATEAIIAHDAFASDVAVRFMDERGGTI